MNKPKITEYDYINFLIGTIPATERLWSEERKHIDLNKGVLIIDDSTLDKFYNQKIDIRSMLQTDCQRRF